MEDIQLPMYVALAVCLNTVFHCPLKPPLLFGPLSWSQIPMSWVKPFAQHCSRRQFKVDHYLDLRMRRKQHTQLDNRENAKEGNQVTNAPTPRKPPDKTTYTIRDCVG
eukprot:4192504-Amphidinium_carterae.1